MGGFLKVLLMSFLCLTHTGLLFCFVVMQHIDYLQYLMLCLYDFPSLQYWEPYKLLFMIYLVCGVLSQQQQTYPELAPTVKNSTLKKKRTRREWLKMKTFFFLARKVSGIFWQNKSSFSEVSWIVMDKMKSFEAIIEYKGQKGEKAKYSI